MLALVALALVLTGLAATSLLRSSLQGQVDTDLRNDAPDVARSILATLSGQAPRSDGPQYSIYVVRLNAADGTEAYTQLGRSTGEPDLPQIPTPEARKRASKVFTVPSESGGGTWRAVVVPYSGQIFFTKSNGSQVVVSSATVAVSLSGIDDTLKRLRLIELFVGIAVLALLGVAGYFVVRSSLKPLVDVERTAEAVAAGDLSRRVRESDPRTEVGRLSRTFNSMISQVEAAFRSRAASEASARSSEERMRRFVGDASHELRTPLTSIRGFAELYRQGAVQERSDVDQVMRRIEDEAQRMGGLVEDMLLLARLDQQRPLERARVHLATLASDAVLDAGAMDPERPVTLETVGADPSPVVLGDDARLRQVLGNLVRNALVHTPPGTPVTVRVGTADVDGTRWALLEVRDEGPGLAPEDAARIFERFFRTDASRTRAAGGTGLGLSIVAALVAAHGGTVGVDTAPGAGATFRVLLPLALADAVAHIPEAELKGLPGTSVPSSISP
ncbi:sensor histidine kinase [Motilibacter aurantiacus]|uniref:sensor histidine kinase n=1 Tax=Motilibacter aurantiacus TaxID=2714955 RepID=UPI001409182A|nr:HAMP domain-containing sensor histidine kinase [Motilibacter aurantiacus]NHC44371.1 HAMP domain-containing histidine kinase [Motilibacter aurantiacus]